MSIISQSRSRNVGAVFMAIIVCAGAVLPVPAQAATSVSSGISQEVLPAFTRILQTFSSFLAQQRTATASLSGGGAGVASAYAGTFGLSQRIDQLANTAINTPTITGGSISNATIGGYLPLSGGTLTGALSLTNALSIANGGTGTTTATGITNAIQFLQAGSGVLSRNVSDKLRDTISVKDFGAKGDGVTDDTAAINAAIAALSAGQTLLFPASSAAYVVSASLTPIPNGASILFDSGAWIKRSASAGNIIFFTVTGNNIVQANIDGNEYPLSGGIPGTWLAESFGIYSNISNPADNVIVHNSQIKNIHTGIRADGITHWRIYGNLITRTKNSGILMGANDTYPVKYNIISNNTFQDHGDTAVAFYQQTSNAEISYNQVTNNTAKNTQYRTNGYAFDVEAGLAAGFLHHNAFIGNTVEQSTSTSYSQGGLTMGDYNAYSVITDNVVRGNGHLNADNGINLASSTNMLVSGNSIDGFQGAAVNADGATHTLISGNTIKNSGGNSSSYPAIRVAMSRSSQNIAVQGNYLSWDDSYAYAGVGSAAIGVFVAIGKTVSNIDISDNTIVNAIDVPMYMAGLSGNYLTNVTIANNTMIGGNALFTRWPINASYVKKLFISGNNVKDAKSGFSLQNNDFVLFSNNALKNDIAATLSSLIDITGTTNVNMYNNDFSATATQTITPATSNIQTRIISGSSGLARLVFAGNSDAGYIDYDNAANDFIFRNNNAVTVTIKNSGNVGIGTTSPGTRLDLGTPSQGDIMYLYNDGSDKYGFGFSSSNGLNVFGGGSAPITFRTGGPSGTVLAKMLSNGSVGIGTTTPNDTLTIAASAAPQIALTDGTATSNEWTLRNAGGVLYIATSTYSATSSVSAFKLDANGNLTIIGSATTCTIGNGTSATNCSSSDQRLKDDIQTLAATSGLAAINALNPVSFHWNSWMQSTGNSTSTQFGFVAQEVQKVFPNLVEEDPNTHYYKLDYQGLIAPIIKAIQEIASISGGFKSNLIAWLGDAGNGIKDIFADRIVGREICAKKSDATLICVTGDELAAALGGTASGGSGARGDTSSGGAAPGTSSPPVISIKR